MPRNFTNQITVNGWTNLSTAARTAGYTGSDNPSGEITLVNSTATACYLHLSDDATTAPNIGGTAQVETQTVVVTAVTAGNAKVVITGADVDGSPVTTEFTVANNDTASQVATKMRAKLNTESQVTDAYTVGGTGADVTLTQIIKNGDDNTLNFTIEDDTSGGITDDLTSVNTTAGVHAGLSGVLVSTAGPSSVYTLQDVALASVWLYTASSLTPTVLIAEG